MKRYSILIVDDDPGFRNGLRRLFLVMKETLDCDVREAATGSEAMAVLGKCVVDCILIDNQMPGGSGADWIGRLLEASPTTAIVMITGMGNEQLVVETMKRGATDYLVKGSITLESLQRTVINALDKAQLKMAIEVQRRQLLVAERQRVMIESLGAACHHLGQPATVIATYLHMLREKATAPDAAEMLDGCISAVESIASILSKFQQISEYRREPYLVFGQDGSEPRESYILAI